MRVNRKAPPRIWHSDRLAALLAGTPLVAKLLALVLLWLVLISMAVLATMATYAAGKVGFDFRYFWLAGKMWAEGVSPYGPVFHETGLRAIAEGHVPVIWPYPPNFWWFAVGLGLFDMESAWNIWLGIKLAVLPVASAVLAMGLRADRMPALLGQRMKLTRFGFFSLQFLLLTMIGPTHFDLFAGQSTAFMFLGAALVFAGLSRERRLPAVIGLAILFVKPQIGVPVGLGLMLAGREGFGLTLRAGLLSLALIVPPMIVQPTVVLDWLHSVGEYDGVAFANSADKMSGIRHLIWLWTKTDIGNLVAMGMALVAAAAAAVLCRRAARAAGLPRSQAAADLVLLEIVLVLALAPLHLYDFLFVGIAPVLLLRLCGLRLVAGLAGVALCLHPSALQIWMDGGSSIPLFAGTTLATIGMTILLLVLIVLREAPRTESPAMPRGAFRGATGGEVLPRRSGA